MAWKDVSHNGYGVITETIKTYSAPRAIYTSEFSVPPGKDFTVISNYGATNLSASTHVEVFYADVYGGTYRARGLTVGGFNSTTCGIDAATKKNVVDISSHGEFPVYKFKVPSGGGLVKFVIFWGASPVTNIT